MMRLRERSSGRGTQLPLSRLDQLSRNSSTGNFEASK
jgi:hypothetical protein